MKGNLKEVVIVLLFVALMAGAVVYSRNHTDSSLFPNSSTSTSDTVKHTSPSITKIAIHEENFTGTRLLITGQRVAEISAQKYVDDTIAEFKATADADVPEIRAQMGGDSASSDYSIDFDGTYVQSDTTESVVISVYRFTGGAHGTTLYKVFTASLKDDALMSLSSLVKPESQNAFVSYVQKSLLAWRPEGSTQMVVFKDDVSNLNFGSFANWSLDNKSLTLYFDQYDIGPGSLGAVPFVIPLRNIQSFLVAR
jgi:Protein of unknown function (DUF3298)